LKFHKLIVSVLTRKQHFSLINSHVLIVYILWLILRFLWHFLVHRFPIWGKIDSRCTFVVVFNIPIVIGCLVNFNICRIHLVSRVVDTKLKALPYMDMILWQVDLIVLKWQCPQSKANIHGEFSLWQIFQSSFFMCWIPCVFYPCKPLFCYSIQSIASIFVCKRISNSTKLMNYL